MFMRERERNERDTERDVGMEKHRKQRSRERERQRQPEWRKTGQRQREDHTTWIVRAGKNRSEHPYTSPFTDKTTEAKRGICQSERCRVGMLNQVAWLPAGLKRERGIRWGKREVEARSRDSLAAHVRTVTPCGMKAKFR